MFKNNFGVKGPDSLLKALTEEARKLGWTTRCKEITTYVFFNGDIKDEGIEVGEYWSSSIIQGHYYKLPGDWDNCIKLLSEKKEDYKIGEWLYGQTSYSSFIFKNGGKNKVGNFKSLFSIQETNSGALRLDEYEVNYTADDTVKRRATEEEIKEFLIKAATQKGFVEGLALKRVLCITDNQLRGYGGEIKRDSWVYIPADDTLRNTGVTIYNNGKWATIQEDQGLCFGDKNVHIYKDGHVTFDEYTADIKDLKAVFDWHFPCILVGGFSFHPWHNKVVINSNTKVKIGCTTGTLSELTAIIDKYSELSE